MYTQVSDQWASLLGGSVSVVASASVVLGTDVILDDLPVVGGSITKSSDGRQVQQTLRLDTVDDTGVLQMGPYAPLMPLGQQVVLRAGLADKGDRPTFRELLPMGTFGIDQPDPNTNVPWKVYPNGAWVTTGGTVTVNGSDPLVQVGREDFVAPERPAASATVRSETSRLLMDRLPVASTWAGGINDTTSVSRSVIYDTSRATTLLNLAQMAGGVAWVNRAGAYEVLLQSRQASGVWTLSVADPASPDDRSAMTGWRPVVTRDGIYNAVIITSEDAFGNELRGVVYETTGPLRWGGPHGQVPLIEENRLARSNAQCQTFAQQRSAQIIAGRSINVQVQCLPNFALDPLDTIALRVPNKTILGLITSITYPLGQDLMQMEVSIPFTDWVVS